MNPNTPVIVGISQIQQRLSNLKADQQIGDEPIDMMLNAVRAVANGESLLDPAVTKRVLDRLKDLTAKEEAHEVAMLSDREKEVLALVAGGLTNKEIAAKLIISENTARNRVSRILDKLGLSRRSEAATFAAQHGLLSNDEDEN